MNGNDRPPRKAWPTRLAAVIVASCLVVSGCAQYQELEALPPGKQINLVVVAPDVRAPEAASKGEATGAGAVVGAGTGMAAGAVGAAPAAAICGPLIIYCVFPVMVIGAAAGLVVGGIGGAAIGAVVGLPAEKADALNAYYVEHIGERNLQDELQRAFLDNGGSQWTSGAAGSTTDVTLSLDTLYVTQSKGEELVLIVGANMVVSDGPGKADRTKTYRYRISSDKQPVDWWLEDEGANIRRAFDAGMNTIGDQVVRTLEAGL